MTGAKVLVVEDDSAMREALGRVLGAARFQVLTFPSAEALLEAGLPRESACLVLDIRLPGLSGFELRQRLLRSGASIPVVFITALDNEMNRNEARDRKSTRLNSSHLGISYAV